jgi:hypothetical protein
LKSVHSVNSVHAVCMGLPPDERPRFQRLDQTGAQADSQASDIQVLLLFAQGLRLRNENSMV